MKEQTKTQHDYHTVSHMLQVPHSTSLISLILLAAFRAPSVIVCAAARSCHLDQIQLHADLISSRVVVCAVKLFITLGSQLYRTRFLFHVDSSKPIRVS